MAAMRVPSASSLQPATATSADEARAHFLHAFCARKADTRAHFA